MTRRIRVVMGKTDRNKRQDTRIRRRDVEDDKLPSSKSRKRSDSADDEPFTEWRYIRSSRDVQEVEPEPAKKEGECPSSEGPPETP